MQIEPSVQLPEKTITEIEEARDVATGLPDIEERRHSVPLSPRLSFDMIIGRNRNLSKAKQALSTDKAAIHDCLFMGRVNDRYGLPVALYHPALAALQHELETLDSRSEFVRILESDAQGKQGNFIALDPTLHNLSKAYFRDARAFYQDERQRRPVVKTFFNAIFGPDDLEEEQSSAAGGEEWLAGRTNRRSKGLVPAGEGRADFVWGLSVVLELKNEYGVGGDATLQSSFWYAKSCNSLQVHLHSSRYCLDANAWRK